jgi:hypothetical protein
MVIKSENLVRKKRSKNPLLYRVCISCKKEHNIKTGFYHTNSTLYDDGKYPVCKECLTKNLPLANPKDLNYISAVNGLLAEINRPYIHELWLISAEESERRDMDFLGVYMKNISMPHTKELSHKDSDIITDKESMLHQEQGPSPESTNKMNITTSNVATNKYEDEDVVLTPEDIQSQRDCHRLLGYDPFDGYLALDRKFMYAEIIPYLDEDTLEDQHKISIIIQLINNNSQIRKMDLLINKLSSDFESLLKNSAEIKNLTAIKKQITDNNDKLAKENAIAIKHRGDKKAGRSTLGYLMKDLRELGFEDAEEDYYDMKKAYGMKMTADISSKAIISQLNFDEKDIEDMFKDQRDLIIELQRSKEELEERLRLANKQILDLKTSGEANA